ncbi:MAG: flagellar basal body-associated FliL family protein [Candidatus Cellulosilyticum pullistercoris]|uniref:Flagellar protein FliL n=1 Tax=Candidatus Cellulosilyticum pullistercoris TaxID=2838521 RepID=A0A9E2NP02_9FIRM|nr:flagellar basal body-associated FliL family protein [Candidatus Cellulosilyticum pullistercoris]
MESKFKIFVMVSIAVLGIAIAGSTFWMLKVLNTSQTQSMVSQERPPNKLKEVEVGDAIITNIASEGNGQHFAKIQIKVGVDASDTKNYEAFTSEFAERSASIRNELINVIGEQTYTMLSDTKAGKEKLADEIITRLNKLLGTEMIQAVYYEEYFIQ